MFSLKNLLSCGVRWWVALASNIGGLLLLVEKEVVEFLSGTNVGIVWNIFQLLDLEAGK